MTISGRPLQRGEDGARDGGAVRGADWGEDGKGRAEEGKRKGRQCPRAKASDYGHSFGGLFASGGKLQQVYTVALNVSEKHRL